MNLAPAHQRQMKTIKTSFENTSSQLVHIRKIKINLESIKNIPNEKLILQKIAKDFMKLVELLV